MATRGKEAAIVVLDVGPHMSNHLPALRKSLFLLAESKLLNHSSHELALILFGTTETNNEVHVEMLKEGADDDQYKHISVVQPLTCPDMQCLGKLNSITTGRGSSDHVSALLVALDLMKKALAARAAAFKGRRRLLLIGSFDTEVEELDAEMRDQIAAELHNTGLALEVYGVGDGAPARSDAAAAHRSAHLSGLHELLAKTSGSYKSLPQEIDMTAMFTTKDTVSTGYKAALAIGSSCKVEVQVYKKTAKQPLPSLKLYQPPTAAGGSGLVTRETEYRDPTDRDHVLAAEEKQKGYKYGQQLVPVDDDALLAYKPAPCMDLLGFTDRSNVPRWHYSAECHVVLGVTSADALALSALVRGLANTNKVAVIRYLGNNRGSTIQLMAGTPLVAPSTSLVQQDCLLLNRLPYKDDLRQLLFKDFGSYRNDPSKQHLAPTKEQDQAMRHLVRNLRLAPSVSAGAGLSQQQQSLASQQQQQQGPTKEQLVPEETLNPMLQRFYWFIGQRALDPQFQVPDPTDDLLAAAVLDQACPDDLTAAASAALKALPELFTVMERMPAAPGDEAAAAPGGAAPAPAAAGAVISDEGGVRLVTDVTDDQPVETFNALLKHGQTEKALSGMQRVIRELVEGSTGSRQFPRAVQAVQALRQAAVQHTTPAIFNGYLDQLRDSFKPNPAKREFWLQLMRANVAPISEDEAAGAGLTAAAAEEYVRVHGAEKQQAPEPPKLDAMTVDHEEDEFAGME